jgi:hypothetical protein
MLRNTSATEVAVVCPESWTTVVNGKFEGHLQNKEGHCKDLVNFAPILPGNSHVSKVSAKVARASQFTGITLIVVESSWRGTGREFREVHWTGNIQAAEAAGQRLLQISP